jgi:MFS family permease
VGFFWCFLMWFSTAAFSPSIAAHYHLSVKALGLLASSAIWMAPIGRVIAGWASDRFGAPRTFAVILVVCGLVSIASAFTQNYTLLFAERVIVAIAGVSFVVGIQHVAQWFNANEIGTAKVSMPAPAMSAPAWARWFCRASSAPITTLPFSGSGSSRFSSPAGTSCVAAPPRPSSKAPSHVGAAICAARSSSGAAISPSR